MRYYKSDKYIQDATKFCISEIIEDEDQNYYYYYYSIFDDEIVLPEDMIPISESEFDLIRPYVPESKPQLSPLSETEQAIMDTNVNIEYLLALQELNLLVGES